MERITLIAPPLELRGTTIYTLILARELKLRGYRVTVLAGEGNYSDEFTEEKIPLVRTEISGNFFRDLLYLNHYSNTLNRLRPEIIHITHHSLANIGGLIARRARVPYVVTIQKPVKRAIRFQERYFKGAIAINQPIRQSAVNTGLIPREKVHLIETGAPTDLKPPSKNNAGLIPVVGTINRLEKEQGIKYFIHAAKELINRNVQAHFLVMGAGPGENKIRKLIRKLDMSQHLTLNMSGGSYRQIMDPIDLFVSPVLLEGFGMFVLLAMASGIPVVASAAGGVFSLIKDNETGLIVPKRDVSLFADKIQACLEDREFANKLSLNGFHFVQEHFTLKKMLEGTLDLYHLEGDALEA